MTEQSSNALASTDDREPSVLIPCPFGRSPVVSLGCLTITTRRSHLHVLTHSQLACRGHGADSPLTVRSIPLHTIESQSHAWGLCFLPVYLWGWGLNPLGYTVVKEHWLPNQFLRLASFKQLIPLDLARTSRTDEVVVDRDAHELAGLDELAGDPDVFARWLRVAWGRDRARCLP